MNDSGIKAYVHCGQCLEEKPAGISPADWAQMEAGMVDPITVRFWCLRHNRVIGDLTLAEPIPMTCDSCGEEIKEGHLH